MSDLVYMPTFRSRQQENLVLKSFDFGDHIYPLLEIIKEYDRKPSNKSQKKADAVYGSLIDEIRAKKVFVDLPVYLKERPSMKKEVLNFSREFCADKEKRTKFILSLADLSDRIIPVISSYLHRTGEADSLRFQFDALSSSFDSICFRMLCNHFVEDWEEVSKLVRETDYVIMDLDVIPPYVSPAIKRIVGLWEDFDKCIKIVLRSAINTGIQNVSLNHGKIIYDADNNLLDTYKRDFKADALGDYVGIKKDDLTSGGTISPGFILYDPIDNQYIGFKGKVKNLAEFENTIVPDVLSSEYVRRMRSDHRGYIDDNNIGWETLLKIKEGLVSGRSQAKFKKISMEHYIYCMKRKIECGVFD